MLQTFEKIRKCYRILRRLLYEVTDLYKYYKMLQRIMKNIEYFRNLNVPNFYNDFIHWHTQLKEVIINFIQK